MDQGNGTAVVDDTAADTRRVVLFDFDGVIVRHQTLELFFRERLAGMGRWRLLLAFPLVPFVPLLKRSAAGTRMLGRVFLRVVTFGRREAAYRRLVAAFGRAYARRPGVFCRDAVAALRRHADAGDRVIIVTGNDGHLVEAILDEVNLAGYELAGSQTRGGLFGVRFVRHNVDGVKVRTLDQAGIARPWAIAYGDSLSDIPMLKAADAARLVNPTPKTAKKAARVLGDKLEVLHWY
ncbi:MULTISPECIES: haloacid dehalogenase-like hydrolase [unclassified Luteibacter]|uniref:haloacid dehalogenase-like hydrolase n=1 Tax=unclassified Luteibacter TaxID=2620188 RepID=UPI0008C233C6|nr:MULTISPECIES: haloacid dehalogenase-like hydrolase [unclassified Luteibacter]SEO99318.1 phosphatidylglycerophosphatase C [Luteibacter sp. UNC138MFCol5.1]SEW20053.1 phosphatidylglycerophosphatase C [Luteibacter sp. 329MFSha]